MRYIFALTFMILVSAAALGQQEARTIMWDELLPEGELELLEEMARNSDQPSLMGHFGEPDSEFLPIQIGTFNTVASLNEQKVRMPGYVVPLEHDDEGKVSEYLLVPYYGACIHMPPPPPNQIVYVTSDEAQQYGPIWQPVWVTGIMTTKQTFNAEGNTAYSLKLLEWEFYEE